MIKKIKFSLVKPMADHCCSTPTRVGFIGLTSLVTRISRALDLLGGAMVTFLENERPRITAENFVQGHILHGGRQFFSHDLQGIYITEVLLPCTRLGLYSMKRLTLSLEEGRPPHPERRKSARHSVSGAEPTTRRAPARHSVSGARLTMRAWTKRREEIT